MLRFRLLVVLMVVSLVTSAALGQTLGAVLTSNQEVPPNASPGFGNATVTFDATRANATVTITVANLGSPINNFHIHEAGAGVNGPVIVNLIGLGGTFVNGTMTGTFPVAADVAQRMVTNPGGFYVNVHTVQFPGGVIRGQLSFVTGATITYAAELRPGNEVPAASSNAFGSAFVAFDPISSRIAWEVDASGIANPTLSHIHRGPAGVNGPVIINFATAAAQIPGGRTFGSKAISEVQAGALLATDLTALASPSTAIGYYVNVHSSAFPGGEVRGQLVPANEYAVPIAGRVTNGLGQTFVTDVRVFNPSYTTSITALLEYFAASLTPNGSATAATVVNIAPRATAILDDVGGASGLNVAGTTGALRISSATPLAVTSRIYADLRSAGKGTLGQFVPAQPRGNALRRGVLPQLSNQADLSSGFRTNVGFFNPNPAVVTVRLELRDGAGAVVGTSSLDLQALTQRQNSIETFFTGVDLATATNLTLSFDASAPIFVHAAVNDNVSADSILVPAQADPGVAANQ